MPATAASAAAPPPPRRRRVYATVDPQCEWASTEHDDTLVVDVSGFRKEELRVLYSTNRKLKVTGERQVDGGGHWARFVKVFPVPRSCDAAAIRASMNITNARLSVVLPKRSSSSKDKQSERKGQEGVGGGSPESSSGSMHSAQEVVETDKVEDKEQRQDQGMEEQRKDQETKEQSQDQGMEEQKRHEVMAVQDLPKPGDEDANAVKKDDGDDKGESKRWWRKITVVHVLCFVLILALVGVGGTLLYVTLM